MNIEEFQSVTSQIAQNLNNQALVTELLTKINDTYSEHFTVSKTLQEQTSTYEKEIQELQKTNMNLFLKVSQKPLAPEKSNNPEPLKYEDLIKSMGV